MSSNAGNVCMGSCGNIGTNAVEINGFTYKLCGDYYSLYLEGRGVILGDD